MQVMIEVTNPVAREPPMETISIFFKFMPPMRGPLRLAQAAQTA